MGKQGQTLHFSPGPKRLGEMRAYKKRKYVPGSYHSSSDNIWMARLDYKSDISWGLRRGSERNGFTRLGSIGWLAFATKANAITHGISAPVSFFSLLFIISITLSAVSTRCINDYRLPTKPNLRSEKKRLTGIGGSLLPRWGDAVLRTSYIVLISG